MTNQRHIYPAVLDAVTTYQQGKMSRSSFLRFATLLGVSLPAAYALVGCAQPTTPTQGNTATPTEETVGAIQPGGAFTVAIQV